MALVAKNLGKTYAGKPVVSDVGFTVETGEILGLMGASGSGKSTIFNMLTGAISANNGQVVLDGRNISRLPLNSRSRLGIGYLPQSINLFLDQTVRLNLHIALEVHGWKEGRITDRIDRLCAQFDIKNLLKAPLGTLSGGQRKIVEIAFALAPNPRFLLLDEPFTKLDPKTVAFLVTVIRNLAKSGVGILISSHDFDTLIGLIDNAVVLEDGHIIAQGTAQEIRQNHRVRGAIFGAECLKPDEK